MDSIADIAIPLCKCGLPSRRSGRYCSECHSAYMRNWRPTHPLSPEQRKKANARSHARVYRDRGLIKRETCADCGNSEAEMHHEDYSQPTVVIWLCRNCHLTRHQALSIPQPEAAAGVL